MKGLYSITVTAKLLKLHPRTLMNYEKANLITPERTSTNRRLYSQEDLKKILFLKFLRFEKKMNLAAIKLILNHKLFNLFPDFDPEKHLKEILQ